MKPNQALKSRARLAGKLRSCAAPRPLAPRWSQVPTLKNLLAAATLVLLTGCLGYPDSVTPVTDFELQRYLGKWYEIARLDHPFERGLQGVTAEYAQRPDGSLQVVNRGFAPADGDWKEAEGRALFVREPDEGYLKVSFFGPFYASYVIFELDKTGYQYAFISGADHDYLWLLARKPTISDALRARFVAQASALGFDTEALVWVQHHQRGPNQEGRVSPAGGPAPNPKGRTIK